VSVKSKVKGKATNTIKFKDAFENKNAVEKWHKALPGAKKAENKKQKIVAESALGAASGKMTLFPINALGNLLKEDESFIKGALNKYSIPAKSQSFSIEGFIKGIKIIGDNVSKLNPSGDFDIITALGAHETKSIMSMLIENIKGSSQQIDGKKVSHLVYFCERLLETASKRVNKGMNFYMMFYSQILKERSIAYAIAKKSGNKLNYEYYSLVNWEKEYSDWVGLRGKNSPSKITDALGMEISD